MNVGRLIVFIELVRGCNNTECPSWKSVCDYDGLQIMLESTLRGRLKEIKEVLEGEHPFKRIDIWPYGCGDSLEHPQAGRFFGIIKDSLGKYGKISLATDSRRSLPKEDMWWLSLDKLKIIHKQPESYDWEARAFEWGTIPIPQSHKLITDFISPDIFETWQKHCWGVFDGGRRITELKAVPFHTIKLGTDKPEFIPREKFRIDPLVPVEYSPYEGLPVRRVMISWDGSLRRCLVSPTNHKDVKSLILGEDEICYKCFPLTGAELAKFDSGKVIISPAASCVSDGYFPSY